MKINPNQFKPSDKAILDIGCSNQAEVMIHAFTFEERFARISTIKNPGNEWDVLTNRLAPIIKNGK